jgi:hypothetical protein
MWDKTVQSSDRADTGPARTGTDRSVAVIGRRGEHASSGGAYMRRAKVELICSLDQGHPSMQCRPHPYFCSPPRMQTMFLYHPRSHLL